MKKRAAILTIGDELLIGQVLNSNVQWISDQLIQQGIEVTTHLTVGDSLTEIHSALDYLTGHNSKTPTRCEVLIIGGGLGPTHDDLTMEALSKYTGRELKLDTDWLLQLENYFKSKNRPMAANNKKQAYLLDGATRIDNDCGTAAGQYFTIPTHPQGTCEVFVVPGVPHEMKSMFQRFIGPKLGSSNEKAILKKTLVITGIGESMLAEKCAPVVAKIKVDPNFSMAFLPSPTHVRVRIQTRAEHEPKLNLLIQEILPLIGNDFVGFETETTNAIQLMDQGVVQKLTELKKTVAIAESCTGGLVSHRLTQIPGASKILVGSIVPYQTQTKHSLLSVDENTLKQNDVVSESVVIEMAKKVRALFHSDFGVATTGYLGPTGSANVPVGTVWLAVDSEKGTVTKTFTYENHRERNKERATQSAIDLLRRNVL